MREAIPTSFPFGREAIRQVVDSFIEATESDRISTGRDHVQPPSVERDENDLTSTASNAVPISIAATRTFGYGEAIEGK